MERETVVERNASGVLDICRVKHGGHVASIAAHQKVSHTKACRYRELIAMFELYPAGLTVKDIVALTGVENRNVYAPRCSELKAEGVLDETGERRDGCQVLRLTKAGFSWLAAYQEELTDGEPTREELESIDEKWIESPGSIG